MPETETCTITVAYEPWGSAWWQARQIIEDGDVVIAESETFAVYGWHTRRFDVPTPRVSEEQIRAYRKLVERLTGDGWIPSEIGEDDFIYTMVREKK